MGVHKKESLMFDLVYAHYLIQNVGGNEMAGLKASSFLFSKSRTLSFFFLQTDEVIPVRFDEEFLVWVAAEQPLKDTSFLSNNILDLCGELPIYWLQPIYPKGSSLLSR